jgi:murein L,D-transpeptidase YcbB/YkuD
VRQQTGLHTAGSGGLRARARRRRQGGDQREAGGGGQAQDSSSQAVPAASVSSISLRIAGRRALSALARLSLAALLAGCAPAPRAPEPAAPDLRPLIEAALAWPGEPVPGERLAEPAELARFYAQRAYRPVWLGGDGRAGAALPDLRRGVESAARHGLRPEAYRAGLLARLARRPPPSDPRRLAQLDLLLSDAFLHLARALSTGAVDPRSLHDGFERAGTAAPDPSAALAAALAAGEVAGTLARLAPPHPEYAALVRVLEQLRAASAVGDAAAAARADRVRANLERWRWLPRDLGQRHLRVDTPDYHLRAFEGGEPVLAMRVVVGDLEWQTPLLYGVVRQLVLNPAWLVPRSIATREMLPAARVDPDYFAREGIEVLVNAHGTLREVDPARIDWQTIAAEGFPFWLRQPPGPRNPLGSIKFLFPNPHHVYLHGTPSHAAFDRPLRTLSHGCVRVEDEVALAAFALAPDPQWSAERIRESLRDPREQWVRLASPLPVYLLYFSVSVEAQGRVVFHDDPYDWDRALIQRLDAASLERGSSPQGQPRMGLPPAHPVSERPGRSARRLLQVRSGESLRSALGVGARPARGDAHASRAADDEGGLHLRPR